MYGFFSIALIAMASIIFTTFMQDADNYIISKRTAEAHIQINEMTKLREKMATVDHKGSAISEDGMLNMGIPVGKFLIRDENQSAQDIILATKMFEAARDITMISEPTCDDYASTNKITLQECENFMKKATHFTSFNENNITYSASAAMKEKMVNNSTDLLGNIQKTNYVQKSDPRTQKILASIVTEHGKQLKNNNFVACYRLAQRANEYSTYLSTQLAEQTSVKFSKAIDNNSSLIGSFTDLEKVYIVKAITSVMAKSDFKIILFSASKSIPRKINIDNSVLEAEKKMASENSLSGRIIQNSLNSSPSETQNVPTAFSEEVAKKIGLMDQYLAQ